MRAESQVLRPEIGQTHRKFPVVLAAGFILLVGGVCCEAFAAKHWIAAGPEFQIGMTRQPLLEVPQEMPIDLQAGTRDARDMTKEERICAGAELGNAAFAYVREHQRGLRWYTGDITPNSGLLDELLIWPDSLNVALVLKDGCRVHATDAIGMGACGPRMTDCAAIRVYPQRQPVTYQTINVREASQCLLLIAFPATYDPSDVRDLVLVSSSGEPSDSDMPSLQAKEEDDR